jgi:sRNA-binding regulator protein Hfq
MANVIKTEWFGKQVTVLMVNGKAATGELTEVTDKYVLLGAGAGQTLIMVHAIVAVKLASAKDSQQSGEV